MDDVKTMNQASGGSGLRAYLSPLGVWALGFGCSVGWGAFVMPGTTFLPIAGPLGTVIGLILGAAVMFLIGRNYHFLMHREPDAGGAFTYTKRAFGHDHGFLCAWFLILTYVAIFWANATALSLMVRVLFGNVFQFGFHYQIAGFDIYFGEALLSVLTIAVFGLICAFFRRLVKWLQIVFALALIVGVSLCFFLALAHNGGVLEGFKPAFSTNGNPVSQIFAIVALAPWAFVGFESVSHSTEEFAYSNTRRKSALILVFVLVAATLAYVFLSLLAVTVVPDGYPDWIAYLSDLDHWNGVNSLPTFFSAKSTLGTVGLVLLGVSVLCGILTGLIANYIASSRLAYSMARDHMLPSYLGKLNSRGIPQNAILTVMFVSFFIPFFGRTAIGWIVDVTTIGATIAYAYTSLSAFRIAHRENKKDVRVTGLLGFLFSVLFCLYLLIPEIGAQNTFSTASYLILVSWTVIGILVTRILIGKDQSRRMGKTSLVWITLLILLLFISMLWLRSAVDQATVKTVEKTADRYESTMQELGVDVSDEHVKGAEAFLRGEIYGVSHTFIKDSAIQMSIVVASLVIVFSIVSVIQKRERQMEEQKIRAEQSSRAKSVFLSNMSHDIRTPMNAITGYTAIALQDPELSPRTREYLNKIDVSSRHLLSLINDILDMSRIESGKMELQPEAGDIVATMNKVHDIFSTQMAEKKLTYVVDASGVQDRRVVFDENRLTRILLNLISNAFKFTPTGGSVTVTLRQVGDSENRAEFELTVKDTGIGMSREFAERVFEAFERERSKTVNGIQGTGLGMAITKSFVDLMGGTIEVHTEQGKGTEFVILLTFPLAKDLPEAETGAAAANAETVDFTGKKLLLVEDNPINREIAQMLLTHVGFTVESAENGQAAVDIMKTDAAKTFDVILMDLQMPVKNGYEATEEIRKMGGRNAEIPIIALTANVFAEEIQEMKRIGMNGHIAKPIEIDKMMETLKTVL